ncbi:MULTISPECIES: transcription termination factor Rho [Nocardiaceae]|uniref:Transcription termination factor Rho n=1 Tax=Rhodococcoides kroppenstedtii TaxID=293050 RepID=A0ABS7NQ29_9NOCA|nr:transcription termination factor Rho [Rhodococcus sp. PBTS 1]MBY6313804.1 transcription termination factor Rho [Rhodococcus kroppenstedtii]MBY6320120.1 transcription termination factor Rho [Rhodococcus kroppenstedtii]MBY6399059.1 transcription termination factor Rho [Rhodococcus kroppenstedtii]
MTAAPVAIADDAATGAPERPARARAARRGDGLSGMVLTELRGLAAELGIKGVSGMRKGDLVAAIESKRVPAPTGGSDRAERPAAEPAAPAATSTEPAATSSDVSPVSDGSGSDENASDGGPRRTRNRRGASRRAGAAESATDGDAAAPSADAAPTAAGQDGTEPQTAGRDGAEQAAGRDGAEQAAPSRNGQADAADGDAGDEGRPPRSRGDRSRRDRQNRNEGGNRNDRNEGGNRNDRNDGGNRNDRNDGGNRSDRNDGGNRSDRNDGGNRNDRNDGGNRGNDNRNNGPRDDSSDDDNDGRGRRGRRFRERRRGRDRDGSSNDQREPELRDDDVLQPVAGILDVLDNYAFVRTSGYLAGPNDVYVSMNMVRRNGLRRGDALTGAVRVAREGEQNNSRQKFNPLVRLDTVNGAPPDGNRKRPEFNKLTPLYPNQRLRLETTPNILTTRVIDLVMPIGKGQRALIVSPPKAGKTSVLQSIANAIATNNPECYLMVVLVDERPEEVTDMQRSVKGEVIASTFDRPPSDHTSVAELAIERAKRLVEDGRDVVVLLDSITRLGRAYNNSSPASGRILSGGVDSTALYPPKRFLGAARNIENGGSLTIIATAMVETGSTGDTVIFEEFKGTGNAELKLDRKIAERRVFPAVDVNPSGTRKDELLMSPDEAAVLHKLRRVLSGLDSHQAIDLLIDRLKKSKNNIEFLMSVSKTAPGGMDD